MNRRTFLSSLSAASVAAVAAIASTRVSPVLPVRKQPKLVPVQLKDNELIWSANTSDYARMCISA